MNDIAGRMIVRICVLIVLGGCAGDGARLGQRETERTESRLLFCCQADNDLFRVLSDSGLRCRRYETAEAAIGHAPADAGVLILANGYPDRTTPIEPALLEAAAAKRLRLYVEYPGSMPGLELGQPRGIEWERAVVASRFFSPALNEMQLLSINGCRFTPVKAAHPHLVLARVAGYDAAVFGLPKETYPVLFEHPRGNVLVATTKLSQFVTGRYGPTDAWQNVWRSILAWLGPQVKVPELRWRPAVQPSYGREAKLPADSELRAFRRGIDWYRRGGQLVDCPRQDQVAELVDHPDRWAPLQPGTPVGDGSCGLLEGYCSTIDHLGRQPVRYILRNDGIGESAMAFAFAGVIDGNASDLKVARNLTDFIYFNSPLSKGPRSDPASPSFGLVGWMTKPPALNVYYGDDNARSMLGTLTAAALLKSASWDEPLMRCLLANLRTTGRKGFRGNRLDEKGLQARGWRYFYGRDLTNYKPHYECYLWACYLWAYRQTGYEPFRDRAVTAIRMTMEAYPENWQWVNSLQVERARMLLPLAWLVRTEDTPEHRGWLKRMVIDLAAGQDASGAIREELGDFKNGSHKPPQSNEQYGAGEMSLLQDDGDPVCDLLYTANFAFLGLHEAAAVTKDPFYSELEGKLAQFFCRAQIRSEAHPELDGGWFRAFDIRKWDYWASNGDFGWGAWCIETGWSQSWITSVLAMREMKTSLWDLTGESKVNQHFDKLRKLMLPGDQ